jgi:hypothetical protein
MVKFSGRTLFIGKIKLTSSFFDHEILIQFFSLLQWNRIERLQNVVEQHCCTSSCLDVSKQEMPSRD